MMDIDRLSCETLHLLVGSNPLPNYITALILKPRSIAFYCTNETDTICENLRDVLSEKLHSVNFIKKSIQDAGDTGSIGKAFSDMKSGDHLNYTGGTKIMAAHARLAFQSLFQRSGDADKSASYLDERNSVLRFDAGCPIRLSDMHLDISIDDILRLHGVARMRDIEPKPPLPTPQDAEIIAHRVSGDPGIAKELFKIHKQNGKQISLTCAREAPCKIADVLEAELSVRSFPDGNWTKNTYDRWCEFLWGKWLEDWTGSRVKNIVTESEGQVVIGMNCIRYNSRQFEIDVAVQKGHRLYVISCTTSTQLGLCKSKLFEAAMRARQLGGDLARSALVCLLHGCDTNGAFVDQLRKDFDDFWGATNTPQVFGLDDLREWLGNGNTPNLSSLKKWLES